MPTFQVPQFIEEKPKIIGPFTLRQFLYLAGAGVLSVAAFYMFGFFLFVLIAAISTALAVSFAFIEINGQGLQEIITSALFFWQKPKIYVWKREIVMDTLDVSAVEKIEALRGSMSLQEKIRSAALQITTGVAPLFKEKGRTTPKDKYQTVTFMTGERRQVKRIDF